MKKISEIWNQDFEDGVLVGFTSASVFAFLLFLFVQVFG